MVWAGAIAGAPLFEDLDRRLVLVPRSHDLRPAVEACIRSVYEHAFAARGLVFPSTLIALLDRHGDAVCSAGVRTADEGFFSEIYLDDPIEHVLSRCFAVAVRRDVVFEVTTLASRSAECSGLFIREIARLGSKAGFEWAFFTATERLRRLLGQIGIMTAELGVADPSRIADQSLWGSYYAHSPVVCAVNDGWIGRTDKGSAERRRYA